VKNKKYGYYDGGVVRSGTVSETDLTPQVNFSYKPLTVGQRAVFEGNAMALDNGDVEGLVRLQCEQIIDSLVSWNLKRPDAQGNDVDVDFKDVESLKKVDNFIIDEIFKVINKAPVIAPEQVKN
jgi:hypothetical protein